MNHFVLLLYIILVTLSGGGVLALALLNQRLQHRFTSFLLIVNTALLASLLLRIISSFMSAVLIQSFLDGIGGYVIGFFLGVCVYGGTTLALLTLPKVPRKTLLGVFAAVVLVMGGQLYLLLSGRVETAYHMRIPEMIAISAYLFFLGRLMYKKAAGAGQETLVWLIKTLGILTFLFALVSTGIYLILSLVPGFSDLGISLDYFYYFGWSAVSVAALIRYLTRPHALITGGQVSDAFCRGFGVTEREREVIERISRGMTNQQIADDMCISFTTVRTHVYNIFRKCEVKTRVELLQVLSGYTE
ncbi:MAG: helix-turn-helix transcriptional regulator [Spirochaetales bacterium]|nr:helix-turn-helix transcriptional regulator [Spirochaetales bacterium]MCF7936979.1 helix-turn-helix transcriptional regulator [Spirochaetales bacterium]